MLIVCLLLAVIHTVMAGAEPTQHAELTEGCYTKYVHVSVVKQVPSYSKHCTKIDDTKCKTTFKNSLGTIL